MCVLSLVSLLQRKMNNRLSPETLLSFCGDDGFENETNRCFMFLRKRKLPFYCILKRVIIAIKLEKILLTIRFIVMIIGKPLKVRPRVGVPFIGESPQLCQEAGAGHQCPVSAVLSGGMIVLIGTTRKTLRQSFDLPD